MTIPTAAIVLAGGRGSRLGGTDKAAIDIDGQMLIDHVLAAVAECVPIVAVGPPNLARSGVTVVREDPPFSGPVAGIAAALDALIAAGVPRSGGESPFEQSCFDDTRRNRTRVTAAAATTEDDNRPGPVPAQTWLLACDLPRAGAIIDLLTGRPIPRGDDGIILADSHGHPQWLAGRYRIAALQRAAAALPEVTGVSMKRLLANTRLHTVTDDAGTAIDLDTWADVDHYRNTREDGR